MPKAVVLLLATVAFVFAGCGGSGHGTVAKGDASSEFCGLARKFTKDFKDTSNVDNPKDEAALFKDLRPAIDQLERKAPSAIKADLTVVATSFREADDLLQKYGYDFAKVPEEEASKVSLDDPGVTAASDRVQSYFEKSCRIDTDGDGDTDGIINTTSTTAGDTTPTTAAGG